jgi:hypothetical protein
MNETLYNELLAEFRLAKTPDTEKTFEQKFLERISQQTPNEAKAELSFFKEKILALKAEVIAEKIALAE